MTDQAKAKIWVVPSPWTAIVSRETWNAVNDMRIRDVDEFKKKKLRQSAGRRKFLLSGKCICPSCGEVLLATTDTRGERGLRCHRETGLGCEGRVYFSMRRLERLVVRELKGILSGEAFEAEYMSAVRQELAEERDRVESRRTRLSKQIEKLEKRCDSIELSMFSDPRVVVRFEKRVAALLDEIEDLKAKRATLPSTTALTSAGEYDWGTLDDILDTVLIRAPFLPANAEEYSVRDAIQSVVKSVRFQRLSRFETDVVIEFDLGNAVGLSGDGTVIRRTARYDGCEQQRSLKKKAIATAVEEGSYALGEDAIAKLGNLKVVKRHLSRFDEITLRGIFNALALMTATDAEFRPTCKFLNIDYKSVINSVLNLRRDPDIEEFLRALASIDSRFQAMAKVRVRSRPRRSPRHRFEKYNHPLLKLPHCDPSQSDRWLTDKEWSAVRKVIAAPYREGVEADAKARSDFDTFFEVIRAGTSWSYLAGANAGTGQVAFRMNRRQRDGDLDRATKVLLVLNGLATESEEISFPFMPKIERNKR